MMSIKSQDRRTNLSVLEQAAMCSVESVFVRNQLRWSGHVVRMENNRLPKQMFYSELTEEGEPTMMTTTTMGYFSQNQDSPPTPENHPQNPNDMDRQSASTTPESHPQTPNSLKGSLMSTCNTAAADPVVKEFSVDDIVARIVA
ncbi:hypothetical protein AWC38_SpisGene13663 [Stylophora pistillata]|uniref:Uncharacterized protein n=1 Tax=Stylophora pistillata TaxID=50429 RepID=A0A2B4RTQ1_STYPI|nr:hypothetical protein AWC38_SpisGene13663 [Stylophora pistillata]